MSDKNFFRLLAVVLGICVLGTLAHLIYTVDAYQRCSVIYFIGRELW